MPCELLDWISIRTVKKNPHGLPLRLDCTRCCFHVQYKIQYIACVQCILKDCSRAPRVLKF